ncbi:FliO/MopB family protein [Phosphitispora sp. TUW77]|uniref:FliO/MopB family protein n=1 Tax=Phosphitispora sp. TUW77 TaxID=3152361 RepID=UPI003AB84282
MKQLFTRRILPLFAVFTGYVVLSAEKALAASRELNLENIEEPQVAPMPSMAVLFIKLVLSLIIIVGLAYLTIRFLRKSMKVSSRGDTISILDQYAFSMNKGIYITRIAGKVYVLGVTDQNISLISEITDEEIIDEMIETAEAREAEGVIPPGILERILPSRLNIPGSRQKSFNHHIKKQIQRLQSITEKRGNFTQGDDGDE